MSAQVIPVPVPEGFEWRGEKRAVKQGEWFMDIEGCAVQWVIAQSRISGFILHPLPRRAANHTCTVSVEDLYGKSPIIPQGFEEMGFSVNPPEGATHWLHLEEYAVPINGQQLVIWLKEVSQ